MIDGQHSNENLNFSNNKKSIFCDEKNSKRGRYSFFQKAEKFRFLCICGDFNGNLETWILSNDTEILLKINQQHPLFRKQISSYPIHKISILGELNCSLILNFKFSNNCQFFNIFTIHGDGMIISTQIKENGTFQYDINSPFITLPYFPRNIIQLIQNKKLNIMMVSDKEIIKLKKINDENNNNSNNKKKTEKNDNNDDDHSMDSAPTGRGSEQGSVQENEDCNNIHDDTISVWENNENFPDNGSVKSEDGVLSGKFSLFSQTEMVSS